MVPTGSTSSDSIKYTSKMLVGEKLHPQGADVFFLSSFPKQSSRTSVSTALPVD
jgi:hypothetical protein